MRIGINASFARKEDTGIGQYTIYLLNALLKKSSEHSFILYFEDQESQAHFASQPNYTKKTLVTPIYQRDDLVRKTAWEKVLLPREARKDKIELFFTPYNSATVIPLIPHVMTIHDAVWKIFEKDYLNNFRKNIYAKQTYEALRRATHLVTVSEYSKKEIAKHVGVNLAAVTVIKNGVDASFAYIENRRSVHERLLRLGIDFPYIFYMGGFEKRKNVDFLLNCFKKIVDNYPNIIGKTKLVIAGQLWEREDPLVTNVRRLVEELGLTERVVLLGKVDNRDRVFLYNGADLFVFPSLYEGFGMTVLEAMASGCPVLTSNRAAIPEIAREAAEYFNPEREDELIQHLIKLLADPALRSDLSRRGIYRAKDFSWDSAAQKMLDLIGKFEEIK